MADDRSGGRITLAQVATQAGVSLSTVSKVLNGRPDVSAPTRIKVEELLDEHGYRRSAATPPEAPLLEIVFHELDSIWSMQLIRGVQNIAQRNGMSVVLTETGTRHSPGADWVEGVLRRRPLGVVLVFSTLPDELKKKLWSRAIPFVIVDPAGDPEPDVPSVGSANWAGGLAATRHLTDLGHRRIAVITGPEDMLCSLARLDGFRSALGMAGLTPDPAHVRYGDFHVASGREHALDLLSGPDRPTAIFAGSDLQALGVLEAARVLGLQVPRDLSVVGYDDIPLAQWSSPALTTVNQPLVRMAEEAAQMLLRLRGDRGRTDERAPGDGAGRAGPETRIELGTRLVVRDSTRAPREPAGSQR
ncbi:LacI family DNA-binding transcriptional regulator [Streptomyces fuscigenes]|uniref:LacI family DNA-binding transcriptional regulator n=1 Tax=Streptomyces fuscigenes TaxID=1528880 RepID=UPI001F1CF781|nr:LacI family DNA-binding transcriptional regulator [Streptomyces fuscigenes]MCF3960908.1 LacI family DNA-binding transcriptional regulator [Streptomyces fuscigenes]